MAKEGISKPGGAMKKNDKGFDISDVLGGTLNILGLKIDLAKLLSSPEEVGDRLQELREKLKQAGGKEVIGDEEWSSGGVSIGGHFRTRGILGEREYHIETTAPPRPRKKVARAPEPPEVIEPAADVFDEDEEIVIVAEVPGVGLEDLELKIEGDVLYLSTKPTAQRSYRKEIDLVAEADRDSLSATCRNGVLEMRLRKKPPGSRASKTKRDKRTNKR